MVIPALTNVLFVWCQCWTCRIPWRN